MTVSELVDAYYATWRNGIATFDEAGLRALLADDFVYNGPIAGRRPGMESFVQGLKNFVRTLVQLRVLSRLEGGDEAALLYDCDLSQPSGTFRFAEFLRVGDGKIHEVRLVFDATEFRKLAPPAATAPSERVTS